MKDLQGNIALITGGSSGIGKAVAYELSDRGAHVIIVGRSEEKLSEVQKNITEKGNSCNYFLCDVTKEENVKNTIDSIIEKYKKIDILVNNAGNNDMPRHLHDMTLEDWHRITDVHADGTFLVTKYSVIHMARNNYGRVVFISSDGAKVGLAGNSSYSYAKEGLIGLSRALAKEYGKYGVTFNTVIPGIIETPMTAGPLNGNEELFIKDTPVGFILQADDVAYAVGTFVSPRAKGITAAELLVDGAFSLNCKLDDMMHSMLPNIK